LLTYQNKNPMKNITRFLIHPTLRGLVLALAVIALSSHIARAVPYASGITKSGDTVSFILNQNAANVEVLLDGTVPAAISPNTPTAGMHTFDMTGHTTYQIKVTGNDAPTWTQYVPDQTSTAFYVPYGVSVNKIPSSPNFGKVYVSEALGGTTGGRTTSDGIYMLNADGSDAGWSNGGIGWAGGSNPFKSTIGPDGHLYVADLSDDLVFEFNDDLSVATQLIDSSNRTSAQYVGGVYVEGTQAGGDRKIYLVNRASGDTARKGLIRYDLGANAIATASDTGTQIVGPTYFGASYYPYDVTRDSSGNWYMNTYRGILNQMPPITKFNGAGTLPLNAAAVLWEADKTIYYYANCIDLNEAAGVVTYGQYNDGFVHMFNMTTGAHVDSFDAGSRIQELAYDAAGNLVTVDNTLERARFWSPGGYTVATTSFNGTTSSFQLVRPATQVSVTASQATVSEAGPAIDYTISRVGSTATDLTVYYAMSGTASNGVDYATLSGTAVIPATASSVTLTLTPIEDAIAELSETAILGLLANSNYSAVLPSSATVTILDDENPEISFAAAASKKLLESYAPSKVTHQVVRKGLVTSALTVNINYSGSATRGTDFAGPTAVTVAAGVATANLVLTPINDQVYTGDRTATANIGAGTGYNIGTAGSISATVVDDEVPPGTVLFSDDFEIDSSALWKVNLADPNDGSVVFAWDYSTVGIPAAPGGGGTKGMRMQCGNIVVSQDGLSVSPLGKNFPGDYRLKFDMWINYNGPMPDGGPGSTQNFDAGVGTPGEAAVWLNAYPTPAEGVWFSATGDGADYLSPTHTPGGDYNAVIGAVIQNDDTGFYAAGTGVPDSGIRDASHPFYSLWGGQAAPAAQLALYPNQTGVANVGNAGMAWHTVVITKVGDVVTWAMDGVTLATVTNTTLPFSTNVFVGYQDLFASGTPSDVPAMSFGLVDNLRVQTLTAPTQPIITGIALVSGGTEIQIKFTAGTGDSTSAFALQATTILGTTPVDVSATITSAGAGQFQAVRAIGGNTQFYRIRRN
jgi:YD repeat-containing protein